ncbi:MAG: hypothetical protein V3R95_02560 [Dehalococcoidia bacterium]
MIFLDQLHSDPALIAYGVAGLGCCFAGVRLLMRHRHRLLGLPVTPAGAAVAAGEPGDGGAGGAG